MDGEPAELVATLREGIDTHAQDLETRRLYERWLKRDTWKLTDEALPLLVGVDPDRWPQHAASPGRAAAASAALAALLASDPTVVDGTISPAALREWARKSRVELPAALGMLLDFISRVVPQPLHDDAAAPAPADGDREIVLGAALGLVTKFPDRCRDANGFYDGAMIADLLLEKAVLWFPDRPPALSRDDIARLLERYLV